ncbi:MAG: hypothetical protein VCE43_22355 [Myxococcota bacterium]
MRTGYAFAGSRIYAAASSLLFATTMTLAGCSTLQHSYKLGDVVARSLSTATPEGQLRLALESKYDSAVREIVARKGQPQWLHIVSRDQLYLYFTARDEVVVITRPMVPPGEVRIYERTPGFLLNLLPEPTADAVLAQRSAQVRKSKRPPTPARRRASPAAIARRQTDTGVSFQNFAADLIVARLRTPLSAADPGVTEWRMGRLRDGKSARVATSGTTRYVVRSEAITVSAPIAPRRRETPSKANHAIYRINRAVFGTRADKFERYIDPLVSRVAADTSGRTRIHRRVGGRSVSIIRDTQRGLLVYSVHSK